MEYEATIGLEVHAELLTSTKIFCGCEVAHGEEPNTRCCPVCMGLPGVLPVLNKKVVEYAIRAGIALNCSISERSYMARKNYFYPDCPKNYQITQYELPLCTDGYMDIEVDGIKRRIGIQRIHIEEDAGKAVHGENYSLVDYNRAGVPLIEIVSNPDIKSAAEARTYLEKLRDILKYIGVSNCKMEEGSLRCDANVSVTPSGSEILGIKTEIKNMNSFKNLEKAINYEIKRQVNCLKSGEDIYHETRRWDEETGKTLVMRSKEYAHDYRYFPEPDMFVIEIDRKLFEKIKSEIPELPWDKKQRFISMYSLPSYDCEILTRNKNIADYFEECINLGGKPKDISNWIMGEMLRSLRKCSMEIGDVKITPEHLVKLTQLIANGSISNSAGKDIFEFMFETGEDPEKIAMEKNLIQLSDIETIFKIVNKVIEDNEQSVRDYKCGKSKALTYLMGQVMKTSKGKANPRMVNKLLVDKLKDR